MNGKGTVALEAVIASGLSLLLLMVLTSMLIVFWQTWHQNIQYLHQRQWTAMAFQYLDKDMKNAQGVVLTTNEIRVTLPDGTYVYRVSVEKSFYRGLGSTFYALALVDSARWWWEGDLLWVELTYPNESYRSCYFIPEDKR